MTTPQEIQELLKKWEVTLPGVALAAGVHEAKLSQWDKVQVNGQEIVEIWYRIQKSHLDEIGKNRQFDRIIAFVISAWLRSSERELEFSKSLLVAAEEASDKPAIRLFSDVVRSQEVTLARAKGSWSLLLRRMDRATYATPITESNSAGKAP